MNKRTWSRWEIALLVMPLVILGAPLLARSLKQSDFLLPVVELFQKSEKARRSGCQNWQRQIGLALLQYAADSDDHFPMVISKQPKIAGWADALQPWIKCISCYHCPNDKVLFNVNPIGTGYTSFWLNSHLSEIRKTAVRLPASTLLIGEGSDGIDKTNATYSKNNIPASWLIDSSSPAFRHMGGANYLFVDGHVAWLRPNEVTHCYGRTNCFAIQ